MASLSAKENTMLAILGILTIGPHTGYDIKQHMEQSTQYFWKENYGQIYPGLAELLKNKDVAVRVQRQDGKPDKKIYSITEQGKQLLNNWLSQPMEHMVMLKKNELLLKVFFGSNTSADIIIGHILDHKKKLEEALQIFLGLEEWLLKQETDDPNIKYWLITNDYGKRQFSSLIHWCDDSISLLNKSI
ncbi:MULTISPECIES: PadR family transcriptional regulator [Paenibacillus]|uniref:Transcriptional regulator n=1 Tax=Paenibacillus odorifer TaxID=189426 RepID=A0ABX3GMJ4_9BACL|nr:PadR family transcriptional regulator [Paenibacillus odorifer]OMD33398.1 transcriptional regulator [Paenibacillus odorifer]